MLQLLDLDPLLLQHIAALVYSSSDFENVGEFPMRVTCDPNAWRRVGPLKSTCRALRDACKQCVSGLKYFGIVAQDEEVNRSDKIPIALAGSLPSLVTLECVGGSALPELVSRLPKLRHICMGHYDRSETGDKVCKALASSAGYSSLETLDLSGVTEKGAMVLLPYLKSTIRVFGLSGFVCGKESPLSEEVQRSIRSLSFHECENVEPIVKQLSTSKNLSKFTVFGTPISRAVLVDFFRKAGSLRSLDFCSDEIEDYDYSYHEALRIAPPEHLEHLRYGSDRYCEDENIEAGHIASMLATVANQLLKLDLFLTFRVDEHLLNPILSMPLLPECELNLTVGTDDEGSEKIQSVRLLSAVKDNLVTLGFYQAAVKDLMQLSSFPRLKTIHMDCCIVDKGELIQLARSMNTLTSLTVTGCSHYDEGVDVGECWIRKSMKLADGSDCFNLDDVKQDRIVVLQTRL